MRYVRTYPEQLPELAELLPQIATPVTLINGRHDRVVPLANAEFLDERLPNSRLMIIDAGHFVWEEAPAEYASIILDSISADGLYDESGSEPTASTFAEGASDERRSIQTTATRRRRNSSRPLALTSRTAASATRRLPRVLAPRLDSPSSRHLVSGR